MHRNGSRRELACGSGWPGGYWGGDVTPLHLAAAWTRDPAVIPLLVEAGADVNARDDRGFSPPPRGRATQRERGGGPCAPGGRSGAGCLGDGLQRRLWLGGHPAARGRRVERQPGGDRRTLLDAGADASVRGWGGETLLHRAARGGSPDVVSLLLRAGADVNAVDGGGSTPLHEAARRNPDPAVVELLLDAGADVHVVGSGRQLSGGWGPSTPLHLAAGSNPEPAVVAALLAAGADPNASDEATNGWTPLHLAASQNRNRSVIRVLVAAGADIGARTRTGSTALHLAARENPEVVPLLLELGADLYAADDEGTAALTLIRRNKALRGLGVVGSGGEVPLGSSCPRADRLRTGGPGM